MTTQGLTDLAIRSLIAPEKGQVEQWDERTRGFGVRVSPGGTKAFILVYRFNGRPRRMTLGRYPTVSLSEARKLANDALRSLSRGVDPGAEKARARRTPDVECFENFVDFFIDTYARPKNRSVGETARLLKREFVGAWGKRPIAEIQRHDVAAVIDRMMRQGKHALANRSLATIRKLFNWAIERGVLKQSPCSALRAPAKPVKRDRVLSDDELSAVWKATDEIGYPYGPLARLLILTAQRREEVSGMTWDELDLDQGLWSLGADRTKADRAHVVPLAPQVVAILASIPRFDTQFVFPARRGERGVSGFSKWKQELDDRSGVREWRLHDLRRTAATGMARLGVAPHVVERILNHTTGTLGGVAGVYNRFGYLPEMRFALIAWANHMEAIVSA